MRSIPRDCANHQIRVSTSHDVMLATGNRLAYVFTHPEARRLLQLLEQGSVGSYERVRSTLGLHPQEFQRIVHRLETFDLVWARAPTGAQWEGPRIKIAFELAPKGKVLLDTLQAMDGVMRANRGRLGARTVDPLMGT
jgi:hypothetical protein